MQMLNNDRSLLEITETAESILHSIHTSEIDIGIWETNVLGSNA